tara:strand:+ start:25539 stop:26477 length:939 start_codon:yes stop_codon:yes gene_type:complete
MSIINKKSKILVTGHTGLVGSAVLKQLQKMNYQNIFTCNSKSVDLRNQSKVDNFFTKVKPEAVINAAATVGGILANKTLRGKFIFDNLAIQTNVIHSCYKNKIKDLIFLGSSCIYPRNCKQPIKENYLLTGPLETTNESYAIAKIAGIKMCESYNFQYKTNYKCLMPSNMYGPNDNYDPESSHFFPAIISKVHQAIDEQKDEIVFWGTGKSMRELMYVDDLARACIFFLKKKTNETLINIGSGEEKSIREYVEFVTNKLNFKGKIKFNNNKELDGMPRKIVDSSIAKNYGWKCKTNLEEGFKIVNNEFLNNK